MKVIKIYKFKDSVPDTSIDSDISSEALLIGQNPIENTISGYRTLTVTGRGALGYKLTAQSLDGMDGERYVDSNLPIRPIVVTYQLTTSNAAEMIEMQDKLAAILAAKEFEFSFNDQQDWYYIGTVTATSDIPAGKLSGTGSFTITASDPKKYSTEKTITSSDGSFSFPSGNYLITELAFTPSASTSSFKITNNSGQRLSVLGTVNASDTIHILPRTQSITLNGVSKLSWLAFDSDFENFKATGSGSTVPTGKLTIKYKEMR